MQQKVQFLAALVHEPELLILDEPFSGLDPVNAVVVDRVIRDERARGATVIFSTHVMRQAEAICDRILLIHRGVKRLDATLSEIRSRFDPRRVRYEPLAPLDGGAARLASFAGVARVEAGADGAGFDLALEAGADAQRLVRELAAIGPLRALELARVSLDEVFVRVVRDAEGEAAAAEAREELTREKSA
jgi:ABC-2 type transport system ATP-binding protein